MDFDEFQRWWDKEGGKNAKAREAAGVIKLDEMQTVTGSGEVDIMIMNKKRTYDLQAESKEDWVAWLDALKSARPEIFVEPTAKKLKAKDKKALGAALLEHSLEKKITVELLEEGPLGVSFTEDPDKEPDCAYILSVKKGSQAAALPGSPLAPGMKLTKVGESTTVGKVYAEVIELLKATKQRPLILEFAVPEDQEANHRASDVSTDDSIAPPPPQAEPEAPGMAPQHPQHSSAPPPPPQQAPPLPPPPQVGLDTGTPRPGSVAAVQACLAQSAELPLFKQTVALLRAAVTADNQTATRSHAMLLYMQAAAHAKLVMDSAEANEQVKEGLQKKVHQVDVRIASGLKDPLCAPPTLVELVNPCLPRISACPNLFHVLG